MFPCCVYIFITFNFVIFYQGDASLPNENVDVNDANESQNDFECQGSLDAFESQNALVALTTMGATEELDELTPPKKPKKSPDTEIHVCICGSLYLFLNIIQ